MATMNWYLQYMRDQYDFADEQADTGEVYSAAARVSSQLDSAAQQAREGAGVKGGHYSEADRVEHESESSSDST